MSPAGPVHAPPSSAREAAAAALASLLAAGEAWPPVDRLRFRNLLLDACGSDHRPLVELLLRVGRHGIVDALRALGATSSSVWPSHRTRLVSRACGELFIGADVAAWAVDAWAVALEVVPAPDVQALQRDYAERERQANLARERAEAQSAALLRRSAVAAARHGAVAAVGARSGGASTAPSWAGGATAGRLGARRRVRAGPPRWRVAATPMPAPDMKKFFALFGLVLVTMGALVFSARKLTPALNVVRPATSVPSVSLDGAPPGASAVAPDDSAPPRATATAPDDSASPRATATAPDDGASPRATATAPAESVRPGATPPVVPRPTVLNDAAAAAWRVPTWWAEDPVARGVGGRYSVEQRILSVGGDDLCRPVAEALARSNGRTVEEVQHQPGSSQFELVSRPGVRGVLQSGGAFQTARHSGEHDGVRFSFSMRGEFTPQGFVARTVTTTDAVIRYRMRQRCVVAAQLIATRLSSTSEGERASATDPTVPQP